MLYKYYAYSDFKDIIISDSNGIIYNNNKRDVSKVIPLPCVHSVFSNNKVYKLIKSVVNYDLLEHFLNEYGYTLNNIQPFNVKFDNTETNKACTYINTKKIIFNTNFFRGLSSVGKTLIYYHELAHQLFNGNDKEKETKCDIYALIRCYCEGYSLFMINKAFVYTLSNNYTNNMRIKVILDKLNELDRNLDILDLK